MKSPSQSSLPCARSGEFFHFFKLILPLLILADEHDLSYTRVKKTNIKKWFGRPELEMTLFGWTALRLGLFFAASSCSPSWPSSSFSTSWTHASWGWLSWWCYLFKGQDLPHGDLNIFNWLLTVLWGTLALHSSTEAFLKSSLKGFPSSYTGVESVKKLSAVGCQMNSLCLRVIIFFTNNTLQYSIPVQNNWHVPCKGRKLYFFRPITFIQVCCKNQRA